MSDLHMNGEYERDPWGYLGMTVRIYRAKADRSLYAMRSERGVIATAKDMKALDDYARQQRWVPTYRAWNRDGEEVWVSIPD